MLTVDEILVLPFHVSNSGYAIVYIADHPHAWKGGKMKRSRAVAFAAGMQLGEGDVVHHLNENRLDDRPENLSVLLGSEHTREHHTSVPHPVDRKRVSATVKQKMAERMKGNSYGSANRGRTFSVEHRAALSVPRSCPICGMVGVNARSHDRHFEISYG